MAIANITWGFVPGSLSTLVEYKEASSSVWIIPTTPTNPTITNSYSLTIDDNVIYDVRLTTNGITCGPKSTTFQIIRPAECCPPGYTMSDDETFCYQVNETTVTPPSDSEDAFAVVSIAYNPFGTLIMDPGYAVSGVGSFTQIPYTNGFWVNGPGYPTTTGNTSSGPMNRAGVWSNTVFVGQQIGFSVCVTLPEDGIYYVGISCDDRAQIKIDGNTIVDQDRAALGANLRANGYPAQMDSNSAFTFFYIYPVNLTAGNHVIEMIGINTQGTLFGNASLACEIYNLTAAEIQSATSYGAMGAGLIFSSKDYIGEPIQVGTGGIGYTCPDGYAVAFCEDPIICRQVLTTPPIVCSTTTTTTTTL